MKVEVKGIPIRHNGQLYQKGESFSVMEKEYARLEQYVKVLEEDESSAPLLVGEMDLPALKDYAKQQSIDLGKATKREDVLAVILKAGEAGGGAS
ncbi:hypothetical protein HQN87_08340 [Paenibacillus tritici]|uniref:DUF7210 domain-containing protein n=1 Tax=Paenibacillus tritici TaxID=1873425 RepID=A0ABX2DL34_9BACL|nr:hypothetical protein [Paenibacillus tritici]NQX45339.1 hypothetical protein [Paenibacillus tritici]